MLYSILVAYFFSSPAASLLSPVSSCHWVLLIFCVLLPCDKRSSSHHCSGPPSLGLFQLPLLPAGTSLPPGPPPCSPSHSLKLHPSSLAITLLKGFPVESYYRIDNTCASPLIHQGPPYVGLPFLSSLDLYHSQLCFCLDDFLSCKQCSNLLAGLCSCKLFLPSLFDCCMAKWFKNGKIINIKV